MTFTMHFEPMTIEHLGLRLYSTLPPVISELVSNAYDAESPKVDITIPTGSISAESEVIVRDYGHGLSQDEIQSQFLPIGRQRRGKDGTVVMSKTGKVHVTGRKGLGKLSAFGVAGEMDVRFIQSGHACCLRLNWDQMRSWTETHAPKDPYEPTVVFEKTGPTSEPDGVEVRLRKLHRKRAISEVELRKGLARRLDIVGSKFSIFVNGNGIQPGDRLRRGDCAPDFSWDVSEIPNLGAQVGNGFSVTGWIGFLEGSSQTNRGIDIFANKKAAELGSFFNSGTTHAQYARAYLVGEIHADFLDGSEDLISTARNSVVWESEPGQLLQTWGQGVLKWAFNEWIRLRRTKKTSKIYAVGGFDAWLKTRQPSEMRVAERMVKLLVDDPEIEPDSAAALIEVVKASVETKAFHELIDTIESEGANAATLLRLFEEWRVIEAREHLRLADGRLAVVDQLKAFINSDALEVQQMQPLFAKNPWLIDHAWAETDAQTTYTKMLREHCSEPKDYEDSDRRLDILGMRHGGGVMVVELKRPNKTLSRRDLEQIEKYVDWARAQFKGSGSDAPKYVHGLLIVGKQSPLADVKEKVQRLAGDDIRVETYGDLYQRSNEYYSVVERTLERIAPEYTRRSRRAKKVP